MVNHRRGRDPVEGNTQVGTYAQVWNGTKKVTRGGLSRNALKMNPRGRIVSRAKSMAGRAAYERNGLSAYKYSRLSRR
jgi:hypothetical protein